MTPEAKPPVEFDTSEIEGIRFQCQGCGSCCHRQAILITSKELLRILNYLKGLPQQDIEKFIKQCYAFLDLNNICRFTFGDYEKGMKQNLSGPYLPREMATFKECHIITSMILFFQRDTQRCIFFNPLSDTCFIYPVRPLVCRNYPCHSYGEREGKEVISFEDCPGKGYGMEVDVKEVVGRMRQQLDEYIDDAKFVEGFIKEKIKNKELTEPIKPKNYEKPRIPITKEEVQKEVDNTLEGYFDRKGSEYNKEMELKPLINPWVEKGILPPAAIESLWSLLLSEKKKSERHP